MNKLPKQFNKTMPMSYNSKFKSFLDKKSNRIVKNSTDDQIIEKLDKLDELVSQLKTNPSSSSQKEKYKKRKKLQQRLHSKQLILILQN